MQTVSVDLVLFVRGNVPHTTVYKSTTLFCSRSLFANLKKPRSVLQNTAGKTNGGLFKDHVACVKLLWRVGKLGCRILVNIRQGHFLVILIKQHDLTLLGNKRSSCSHLHSQFVESPQVLSPRKHNVTEQAYLYTADRTFLIVSSQPTCELLEVTAASFGSDDAEWFSLQGTAARHCRCSALPPYHCN